MKIILLNIEELFLLPLNLRFGSAKGISRLRMVKLHNTLHAPKHTQLNSQEVSSAATTVETW